MNKVNEAHGERGDVVQTEELHCQAFRVQLWCDVREEP